jgi:hypothetical protein
MAADGKKSWVLSAVLRDTGYQSKNKEKTYASHPIDWRADDIARAAEDRRI